MNNKVKFIQLLSLACVFGFMTFSIQSCKDDDKPPVITNDDDNTNPDPLTGKDYLKFEGIKVEFRNPSIGKMDYSAGDTSLRWGGNKPETITGDTVLSINHPGYNSDLDDLPRKEGLFTFSENPVEGQVRSTIQWGTADGYPVVKLTGGKYELKRVDGKWVSILKNGTGTWTKSNGDKVNYTGIEFKATWPN